MTKNPLVSHFCGVCMATFPETELEFQFLYGREPWFCCHSCLVCPPWLKERPAPEAQFAVEKPALRREDDFSG